ncbi:Dihydroxy-acid dehydratase [Picochlorum sp. SENEW3]|nr:Dihydroxy-acid dehydratase [Picochlorum sp. SENEW3]
MRALRHSTRECNLLCSRIRRQHQGVGPYHRSRRTTVTRCGIDEVLKQNAPEKQSEVEGLNKFSRRITQPKSQGASQAMLYGTGLTPDDMNKPQVGISSVWWEGNTCNMHLNDLALEVKLGVEDAGLVGYRFNTIGVSDGISMGTDGMSFSLQSRDLIADSIETVMSAQWYDANISLPGCDKNMPGTIMAMARLNRPSIMIYGGTIRAGTSETGNKLDIVSAFQSYGGFSAGLIDEHERQDIVKRSCPGPGACGGMYTANTMASAIEALGMSLPYSSSTPAEDPLKKVECRLAGRYLLDLMKKDIKPLDIMKKASFENAIVFVMATGGSTNAVLHLIAMARTCGIELTLDDFQRISDKVPFIADLKPSGKYVMEDLHKVGGTPAVLKYLMEHGLIDGSCLTVTGKTLAENLDTCPPLMEGQDVILPLDKPIKSSGHLQILYGNLSPEGSVAKITGKEGLRFKGHALCFDCEEDMLEALSKDIEPFRGSVVVIRYEGPKGGPGMPEMLTPTSAIMGAGLGDECALITDGRFSGGSHGFVIGHVCPEAQEGGPIGLVRDGDIISIDAETREMNVLGVDDAEWEKRKAEWKPPASQSTKAQFGTLRKYTRLVSSASTGCVTDQ